MKTPNNIRQHSSTNWVVLGIALVASMLYTISASAQGSDTVVVNFGDSSMAIFQIQNQKDLDALKKFDMNKLVNDIANTLDSANRQASTQPETPSNNDYLRDSDSVDQPVEQAKESKKAKYPRGDHDFSVDIGINNFLEDGSFPSGDEQPYSVRPWGSWYVGLFSEYTLRFSRSYALKWGAGVDWYNFKFQNDNTTVNSSDDNVVFAEDTRVLNFKKSKLTVAYVTTYLMQQIHLGGQRRKHKNGERKLGEPFRIGMGGYVGYRIDSYSKIVFEEDGDRTRSRNHDDFFLNDLRYGIRGTLGFGEVDFFVNYDLNTLFASEKGPELNAVSFGFIL